MGILDRLTEDPAGYVLPHRGGTGKLYDAATEWEYTGVIDPSDPSTREWETSQTADARVQTTQTDVERYSTTQGGSSQTVQYTKGDGTTHFWDAAQAGVKEAGGDPDDLVSVTKTSPGTTGEFSVTDVTMEGDLKVPDNDPVGGDDENQGENQDDNEDGQPDPPARTGTLLPMVTLGATVVGGVGLLMVIRGVVF